MANESVTPGASPEQPRLDDQAWESLFDATKDQQPVEGLTHSFYRYPARFSPQFARATIKALTRPGDLVVDPFMGGGTTLIEAAALGRRSIGTDISSLAEFLAKVKTTRLSDEDLEAATDWADHMVPTLTLNQEVERPSGWIDRGYQRNINGIRTWPIRKSIELALNSLPHKNRCPVLSDFLRCAVLSSGQWALDCRSQTPTAGEFRVKLRETVYDMVIGMNYFEHEIEQNAEFFVPVIVNGSAEDLDGLSALSGTIPRLILTSPPYPGVHVLYHRWQIHGRKETPAPFWIAERRDGRGSSYYTLGDRRQQDLRDYFGNLRRCFRAIRRIAGPETLLVQLVAFSRPKRQLERYLDVLAESDFVEVDPVENSETQGRIWRTVPNRRWYARHRRKLASKNEVLLIHRPVK